MTVGMWLRHWSGWVLLLWIGIGLLAGLLPLEPNRIDLETMLASPSGGIVLGTDELGRQILDRLLLGARTACTVSLMVVSVSALVGTSLGLAAGYFGGWLDRLLGRVIDVFLAFPGLLLAIALAAVLGPGLNNLVLALVVMGWVGFARLARAQALQLREQDHVLAARALGQGELAILRRHILPLAWGPILIEASFGVSAVVVAEAGLSFLGLGVQAPEASWGGMIRDGVRYMLVAPHLVLAPGLALTLVVLATNVAGDRLRHYLDPRNRERL